MTPELKQRWVDALRSGDYQQGQSYLANNGSYCCLGVLCEVAEFERVKKRGYLHIIYRNSDGKESTIGMLKHLTEVVGMSKRVQAILYHMNDGIEMNDFQIPPEGLKFPDIAAWIEKHDMLSEEVSYASR